MKLKVYTLVSFIAVCFCFVSHTHAIMEDKILEFLEEVRNRMCHPLFGYAPLDPLEIASATFNMDNKYIVNLTSSVTDFLLTGLSDFNVTSLRISSIPLRRSNFNIILPLTSVNTLYDARGSLAYILNLNGNDKAEGHIDDVKLSISWALKTGLTVGIRNLKIEISIGNLFVNIQNPTEEPRLNEFLNALINEIGIELLNDLWVEAQKRDFIQYVENYINKFLGSYTLGDIIKIIGTIVDGEEPPFSDTPANCKANKIQKH